MADSDSPTNCLGSMQSILRNQMKAMVTSKKNEIMFNRSWKTFKRIQEQSKLEDKLMSKSKQSIDYQIKYGFGSKYKKNVIKRTVSQIIDDKSQPTEVTRNDIKLTRECTI